MISEIIHANVICFMLIVLLGVVSGIVYAWRPNIAVFLYAVGILCVIAMVVYDVLTSGFGDFGHWYEYIGLFIGAITWDIWVKSGKKVYNTAVSK